MELRITAYEIAKTPIKTQLARPVQSEVGNLRRLSGEYPVASFSHNKKLI
jgi:hypothetical protein